MASSAGVAPEEIELAIKERLEATHVDLLDTSGNYITFTSATAFEYIGRILYSPMANSNACTPGGCGQMFEATIVSPQFAGKRSLQRHRLVNTALKEEIAALHAWTQKCYTPEEWEKEKEKA